MDVNETLRRKNAKIEMERDELQKLYDELSQNYARIMYENNELRQNLKTMTERIEKLERKDNLDEDKYMICDSDLITDWIV